MYKKFNNLDKMTRSMWLTQDSIKMPGCRVHSQQTMDNELELSIGIELE